MGNDSAMETELGLHWDRIVSQLREALRLRVKPVGEETQSSLAARAGVSRPHVVNYLQGRKTPSPDVLGKIAAAIGLHLADFTETREGLVVGTVDAEGIVTFNAAVQMGRMELVHGLRDWEKPIQAASMLVVEASDAPVVDRWNVLQDELGTYTLMRATRFRSETFLLTVPAGNM